MKYGFLGAGNMAQTIIKGFIGSGYVAKENIFIYDIDAAKQDAFAKDTGVNLSSTAEIVSGCDVVVLAIKPNKLVELLHNIEPGIKKHSPILLSLPAGFSLGDLTGELGFDTPIIRIVPNICSEVFASVTGFCANKQVPADKKSEIFENLKGIGSVIEVDETSIDAFTVIASSSPAFVFRFAESLSNAALKEGLPKPVSRQIIYEMIAGSAKMLAHYDGHPGDLEDKVSSPGGSTIEGLLALTQNGFESSVHNAVKACISKLKVLK